MQKTRHLTQLLNIQYPVIQGPMLGVTTPEMVAAISESGGLGSLPVGGLSPEKTATLIRETKAKTDKPFAVNVFAHDLPASINVDEVNRMQDFLETFSRENGIPFKRKSWDDFKFYSYMDQIDVILEEAVSIVSFTFGLLNAEIVERFKESSIVSIGTATSVSEVKTLSDAGIDIVTAQGIEAGGHRGSFLEKELPQVGLISLLSQSVDSVNTPLIAAGGIYDEKTIKAALTLRASGVQIGTLFITAEESAACEAYKDAVVAAQATDTTLTRAFSGRWARGIKNGFMESMEASGISIPVYNFQNSLTAQMRTYGQQNNLKDFISMWAGQSSAKAYRGTARDIFTALVDSVQFDLY